jgi:hypothetical protein
MRTDFSGRPSKSPRQEIPLHKNGANRTIALKVGGLEEDFRFFPQAFPLLCAKLNAREIFFVAQRCETCTKLLKISSAGVLTPAKHEC